MKSETFHFSKQKIPVFLDVDTGIDDALALLLAIRAPELEVIGVSCVAGNTDVDTVLQATLKVLDAAGAPADISVSRGFAAPLVEPCHPCPEIHGTDSLGDLDPPLPPSSRPVDPSHAVVALLAALRTAPHPVTVIALAPLTNIAVAIRTDPELFQKKVERLVWMGGAVAGKGNATPCAEANAFYDPEAAHIVLTSGVPIIVYPWDVYLEVSVSAEDLIDLGIVDIDTTTMKGVGASEEEDGSQTPLPAGPTTDGAISGTPPTPLASSWSQLAARLLYRDMRHWDMAEAQIGDAGAVAMVIALGTGSLGTGSLGTGSLTEGDPAAALCEEAVKLSPMHVAIELHGERTRGMTVCDRREFVVPPDKTPEKPNASVCTNVNPARLKAIFLERVMKI